MFESNLKLVSVHAVWMTIIFLAIPPDLQAQNPQTDVLVFILAGQSNMEGQGVVDLDHPMYYNSGRGTLLKLANDPKNRAKMGHVRTPAGDWVVRDDVYCRFVTRNGLKKGPLSIGFAGYPGKHHIGPEFQFGHVIGDAVDAPVVLIKTAWGGKSLFKDFRPPSAGGETGPYYRQMLEEVKTGLDSLEVDFPELKGRNARLAGFVWFQGWNDAFGPEKARSEYAKNLVCLIRDVREEFKSPHLPVVVGELGNGGLKVGANIVAIREAQRAAVATESIKDNASFVSTTAFARAAEDSPNKTHGHHWFGNAESYFLIGDALGRAMVELMDDTSGPAKP
ncbi:MAG: sialate O-acetylesterase [Planctomycetota bacterium]|nr:sialate O-acetylesterase [Planctomycetota bacterium]